MTDYQSSNYGAVPISLYEFLRGSIAYRYTSADRDQVYLKPGGTAPGDTYSAIPISDGGLIQSGETQDDNVTITLPWATDLVRLFNGTAPSDKVFLTIRRLQAGDTVAYVAWSGSISEVKRATPASAEVTCETISQSFLRNGLTQSWSRSCPYFLYDPTTCKVDQTEFQAQAVVAAVSGVTLSSPTFGFKGDNYYTGGFVEWLVGGTDDTYERVAIEEQLGGELTLLGIPQGVVAGLLVNVYPGCDRSCATCASKFNNLANCGAAPFLPGISPFDGTINVF